MSNIKKLPGIFALILAVTFVAGLCLGMLPFRALAGLGFFTLLYATILNRGITREVKTGDGYALRVLCKFTYLTSRIGQTVVFGSVLLGLVLKWI